MNLIKYTVTFLLGVYAGQEYGLVIPNVKDKANEMYGNFKKTELYKKIEQDFYGKK